MINKELKKAVVFAILMENNQGILEKSPSYVLEKWNAVEQLGENCTILLDSNNLEKLNKYQKIWFTD